MKTFLFTAAFAVISTASHACVLSDNDIRSLAASPSHLTQSEFNALTPARQNAVCSTRAFIAHVDAQKGVITDIEPYSEKWLTSAENARIVAASNAFAEKMIREGR